jgi:hypothetical protein
MRKLIAVIFIIFHAALLKGQPSFDLGLKTGLTLSSLRPLQKWENIKDNLKIHIGAFSRVGWGRFYLQPEAYFNSRGGDLKKVSNDPSLNINANFDFSSLDVPLLAGCKVINLNNLNARIMGGPVFGFITTKAVEGSQSLSDDYFRNHFYGWQIGAGIDMLAVLTLDARYESSRNSVYQSSDLSARNNLFLLSVGVKLSFAGKKSARRNP